MADLPAGQNLSLTILLVAGFVSDQRKMANQKWVVPFI
jgi:hypothetical protein